jgi:hypothetical protein
VYVNGGWNRTDRCVPGGQSPKQGAGGALRVGLLVAARVAVGVTAADSFRAGAFPLHAAETTALATIQAASKRLPEDA